MRFSVEKKHKPAFASIKENLQKRIGLNISCRARSWHCVATLCPGNVGEIQDFTVKLCYKMRNGLIIVKIATFSSEDNRKVYDKYDNGKNKRGVRPLKTWKIKVKYGHETK